MPTGGADERPSRVAKASKAYLRVQRDLGRRVRQLRLERGLTLDVASERGDLDLKHWQKIEAGQLNVTLVTLVRIAKGLGADIGALFDFAKLNERPSAPRSRPKTKTRASRSD